MSTQKLLIPIDGSEFSRKVLSHVCNIVSPDAFEITLLQVADPPPQMIAPPPSTTYVGIGGNTIPSTITTNPRYAHTVYPAQAEESLTLELIDEMAQDAKLLEDAGFTVSREVRFGDPAKEIITFVEHEGVNLLAMATHGRSGLPRLLMGSVAEAVLRRLAVPILLVHPVDVADRDVQRSNG